MLTDGFSSVFGESARPWARSSALTGTSNVTVDLEIRGGDVLTPEGWRSGAQVLVADERIVAVNDSPDPGVRAERVVDARGSIVIPGAIDTHSHHREPGFTHKEDITTATTAAALGGVTTSIGMPNVDPPTTTAARFAEIIDLYAAKAIVDWNHNPSPGNLDEVEKMAELGCLGFKLYMVTDNHRQYPHMPGLGIHSHAHLFEICETVARTGRPLLVHPNDQGLLLLFEARARAKGDLTFRGYAYSEAAGDGVVWNVAVAALLEIQRASGVKLHVCHMMGPGMVRLVGEAKGRGADVTCEVNPFALFLSDLEEIAHLGPRALGRCIPRRWVEGLWDAIRTGVIDVLGSDHAPHTREEKDVGWHDMWAAPSGTPQLQHYLPRLLTAATEGVVSIEDVVRITAEMPARRFGIYPKKGVIQVGADADIVVCSMSDATPIRDEDAASKAGYSPYAGQKLVGVPRYTVVRGTVVAADGRILVQPGFGRQVLPTESPNRAGGR